MTIINTLTVVGTPGADTLDPTTDSTTSAFVINAFAGADSIVGGEFDDRINAGAGADTVFGGNGNDRITGGNGKDYLNGDAGNDTIDGGAGNDTIGNDFDGDDSGKDLIYGGAGDDVIDEDAGQDTVFGGGGDDTVESGDGKDSVYGDGGDDTLSGQDGGDFLFGGNGDDSVSGDGGADVLNGDDGFDFYTGGGGGDLFVFDVAGTSSEPEEDAITDFTFGTDQIDLRAFDLADWTGSDSQITVVNEGTVPGLPLGSNIKTIYVDLNDDNSAANNIDRAEVVVYVNAGIAGFLRDFIITDGSNPFADILV